jgi:peptidoglycan/xylan/chitin deacetylase (PgdA/CDA1 family)
MDSSISCKRSIKRFMTGSGVFSFAQRISATRIAILRYHSIQDDPARFEHSIGAGIIHTSRCFSDQMELVARRYNPVTLDDVMLFLVTGRPLPRRSVAVTFDDGYLDNVEIAAPIMNRLGIPGTFYVTVDGIAADRPPWFCRLWHAFGTTPCSRFRMADGDEVYDLETPEGKRSGFLAASAACASRNGSRQAEAIQSIEVALAVVPLANEHLMMNWEHVRALRKAGHTLGSHTLTHPNLAQIAAPEAEHELRQSRIRLEAELGEPVFHFSYPNPILEPHWTIATSQLVASAGYRSAVTSQAGPVSARSNSYALQRVSVPNGVDELAWKLECTLLGRSV